MKILGDKGSLLRVEGAWIKGTTDRKKRTAAGWQPGLMWWIDEQVLAPFEISLSEWHIIEAMQPWNYLLNRGKMEIKVQLRVLQFVHFVSLLYFSDSLANMLTCC